MNLTAEHHESFDSASAVKPVSRRLDTNDERVDPRRRGAAMPWDRGQKWSQGRSPRVQGSRTVSSTSGRCMAKLAT